MRSFETSRKAARETKNTPVDLIQQKEHPQDPGVPHDFKYRNPTVQCQIAKFTYVY